MLNRDLPWSSPVHGNNDKKRPRNFSSHFNKTSSEAYRIMTYDPQFMELALEAAQGAYKAMEVPVGCVFVRNGKVLARGGNKPNESLNVRYSRTLMPRYQRNLTVTLCRRLGMQNLRL